jgi:head-tail adaptor
MGKSFQEVRDWLMDHLSPGAEVENWSKDAEEGTSQLEVQAIIIESAPSQDGIVVKSRTKEGTTRGPRHVPWDDIEKVWAKWEGYKAGQVTRSQLREGNDNTTYAIALLHFYDFQKVRDWLMARLHPGKQVENWSRAAELGKNRLRVKAFTIASQPSQLGFMVESQDTSGPRLVQWRDLEKVWEKWEPYKAGRVMRKELCENNVNTTYVIALLRFYEINQ